MAKQLKEWVETDVARVQGKSLKWLSEEYFFRDPSRAAYSDTDYMFSPADGIIVYQSEVQPDDCIVDIKGKSYSLRSAMQDSRFDQPCLVIGIFMTMYDVHINRVSFPGQLTYRLLEPIASFNAPMLAFEQGLIEDLCVDCSDAGYLYSNQRMLNRVYAPLLGQSYYILQVADYDVDCITPFNLGQNVPIDQNRRFSQIRFGSQVDLIVPLSDRWRFEPLQETGTHVEAGVDPLIRIERKSRG